jgi:hypothetical protein
LNDFFGYPRELWCMLAAGLPTESSHPDSMPLKWPSLLQVVPLLIEDTWNIGDFQVTLLPPTANQIQLSISEPCCPHQTPSPRPQQSAAVSSMETVTQNLEHNPSDTG